MGDKERQALLKLLETAWEQLLANSTMDLRLKADRVALRLHLIGGVPVAYSRAPHDCRKICSDDGRRNWATVILVMRNGLAETSHYPSVMRSISNALYRPLDDSLRSALEQFA